jgi:prepilin-type processing-associated H-X9-DG protein
MKQLGMSFRMYVQDYDETLPVNRACVGGVFPGYQTCADGIVTTGWVDMIMPYLKNDGILKCPNDPTPVLNPQASGYRMTVNPAARTNRNRSSYAKNNNLGNVPPPFGYIVGEAAVPFPAATILLFEWGPNQGGGGQPMEDIGATWNIQRDTRDQPEDPCSGTFTPGRRAPNANANQLLNADQLRALGGRAASKRHHDGSNYIFVDGHARWLRPAAVMGQCAWGSFAESGNDGAMADFRL